jgi:hypothetical protein
LLRLLLLQDRPGFSLLRLSMMHLPFGPGQAVACRAMINAVPRFIAQWRGLRRKKRHLTIELFMELS